MDRAGTVQAPYGPERKDCMPEKALLKDVTEVNRGFYDSLYKATPSWLAALRALTSFDQQVKAKPNYDIAKALIAPKNAASEKLRILDYGAGWGTFLLKWPKRLASCWCCDISKESVRQCLSAGRLLGREIEEWCGAGEWFDLVCCSHVLEHLPDDLAALRYLRSITRLGGIVLLNVPINEIWIDPKHVRHYDRTSMRSLIEAAGLTVVFEREGDRISSCLGKIEHAERTAPLTRKALRLVRLLLALAPYRAILQLDRLIPDAYTPSQLIVGGMKLNA